MNKRRTHIYNRQVVLALWIIAAALANPVTSLRTE
jgi:UDP-N-acetylmuramyl pentapeptide phosphotransferase/UDP-N-acetylglucosamine-1-phosphate transferase